MKVKIAYITPDLSNGGAQQHISLLCNTIDRDHYVPIVICLYSAGPFKDQLEKNGIKVILLSGSIIYALGRLINRGKKSKINLGEQKKSETNSFFRSLAFLISEVISGIQLPFVLWLNRVNLLSIHLFTFRTAFIAAKLLGIPTIYTEHGVVDKIYYSKSQIELLKRWVPKVNSIIAVSSATKDSIINVLHVPANKINVIGHSISFLSKIKAEPLTKKESPPTIAVLSRMVNFKGHDCFIQAAKILAKENSQIKFIIASWGELRPQLEEMVRSMGLANRVIFSGEYKNEDLPILLENVWVVAVPSISEALGIVAIEAMACGIPVVASHTGGLVEILHDNQNGILVPPGDPIALACALSQLLNDSKLREKLSKSAFEYASKLTPDKIIFKTMSVYHQTLNSE